VSNHISKLLTYWAGEKDSQQWVLATIITTAGSSYRKPGAMMMINELGQYYGLLSGGCLESDIMRQARRCWDDGRSRIIKYDMREEEDLAWQLGIGCGGMVEILLQTVSADNQYLGLDLVHERLRQNLTTGYCLLVNNEAPHNWLVTNEEHVHALKLGLRQEEQGKVFTQVLRPVPCLAVFGGGVDARPVVAIAVQLGWQVILVDPRSAYAREGYFNGVSQIIRQALSELTEAPWLQSLDAALVLTHNVKLDGEALTLLQHSSSRYVGLLGPRHRTQRVLKQAQLSLCDLHYPLANPVGLRLGGELPESIALSMLAETHAFLESANGFSINNMLAI
jgi:xanthine dehydrogenase accessory factor